MPRSNPRVLRTDDTDLVIQFSLNGALPQGHIIVLNLELGTLSYLYSPNYLQEYPRILCQERFTATELKLLRPLLESFPEICPYSVLYTSLRRNTVNNEMVVIQNRHLLEAKEEGIWSNEISSVQTAISRTRKKLRAFGIDIATAPSYGYSLIVVAQQLTE